MNGLSLKEALRRLSSTLSEDRRALVAAVVAARSSSVALLLENIENSGDVNGVLRTMDALGCLHLHRLNTEPEAHSRKKRRDPKTDVGSRQWVCAHQWQDLHECVTSLRTQQGYRLACACPDAPTPIADVDFDQKLVLAFGKESSGVSEELAKLSDIRFSLPMCGFVRSFNMPTAVALSLYHAYLHRTKRHVNECNRGHSSGVTI